MKEFKDFKSSELDQKTRHGLLLGGIGPRPIAWVSTMDKEHRVNLAPFSFFNVFSSNPPILIFSPARKGRDNTLKHTLENLKEVPECVVNIVSYNLLNQMVISSLEYPKGEDEFKKAGLTALASTDISVPRVGESPMQLECKVLEIKELGNQGGAGNLVICEVLRMHIDQEILDSKGWIDPNKADLIGRMGGAWYTRAHDQSNFQVQSDVTSLGVGFERLPKEARLSTILTGNELGLLANEAVVPDENQVNDFKLEVLHNLFLEHQEDLSALQIALHRKASSYIASKEIDKAWMCILAYNG